MDLEMTGGVPSTWVDAAPRGGPAGIAMPSGPSMYKPGDLGGFGAPPLQQYDFSPVRRFDHLPPPSHSHSHSHSHPHPHFVQHHNLPPLPHPDPQPLWGSPTFTPGLVRQQQAGFASVDGQDIKPFAHMHDRL